MLLALFICGCDSHKNDIRFIRFEQVLFNTPAPQLATTLAANSADYNTPLLNIDPSDSRYMAMLGDFVSDTAMRYIYHVTDSLYHDLGWLEHELGNALQRAGWPQYDRFYTLVTGDFEDYQRRVFCSDHELAISLDHYAIGSIGGGVPSYIERLSRPQYMAADCMAAIARAHIAMPDADLTLLDYAIAEGKVLYFLEQAMPHTPDTIRLRYTKAQLQWMENNTEQVWAWIIQNNVLYSSDLGQFHNLIDEAPKTNAFGEGSAPRTPAYIGWQIVRRYMKKSGDSMQQLFEQTDSRHILTTSAWRP